MRLSGTLDLRESGLPERLRILRENRHLSQSDLAAKAGLSYRTVHDLEAGKRGRILEKTLMLLATALDIELSELLGVEGAAELPRSPMDWRPAATVAAAALVLLAMVGGVVWHMAAGRAQWERQDTLLVVRDGFFGLEMWRLEAPDQVRFVEAAPWDTEELLVGLGARTPEGGRLLCLDRRTGRQRWQVAPDLAQLEAAFGAEIVRAGNLGLRQTLPVDLDGDGRLEVVAEFVHSPYYPTALCLVDRDGRRLRQYAVKGHPYDLAVTDLDGDGRQEVLVAGVNNSAIYGGAMVTLLDHEHFAGASVDPVANPESAVGDTSRFRLVLPVFPPAHQAMMDDTRQCAAEIQVTRTADGRREVSVSVGGSVNGPDRLMVYLSDDLSLLRSDIRDSFAQNIARDWPDSLKGGNGPADAAWRRQWLRKAVRFVDGARVATP